MLTFGQVNGFLKAKGKTIVDGNGKTFILRGMGLGGWMLQEGYMLRIGAIGQQHRIRQKIAELIGNEKTDRFYDAWLKNHTTKRDIDSLAAWGFNSIRLPMHYGLYTLPVEAEPVPGQNTWLPKGFAITDSLLAWCKVNHMYLILDLHATPGGQGNDLNISDRDPSRPSLWESEANQGKTIALWRKLAERYAGDPAIGGYDIINEPNWGFEDPQDVRGTKEKTNKPLRTLMMRITAAIREVDTTHIIIVEGNGFGNNYNGIFPLWDDNMVLSFHKYGNFNTRASIRNFLDWQDKYNVPLWLGESGENSNTWFTQAIQLVESNNIGWCWWPLKKMGISNPLEIKVTPSYQLLLDYWLKNGPKPSVPAAEAALDELLQNIKMENNICHKEVVDAMFRQVASAEAIPFKPHWIKNGSVVAAVDYDLGRNGSAYLDNDTARYQYVSPPIRTTGNRGAAYRNDGVDIQKDSLGYSVFSIEEGEWLQYTVNVTDPGTYTVVFSFSPSGDNGRLSLLSGGRPLAGNIPVSGQSVEIKHIYLKAGLNRLKVIAVKGGFVFREMRFVRN
ncbi:cellulase family glycosylhydrolase [Flavitalea sp. BT771]|uniref:cellulase family glycosylhydrolase n=1 Tax=Flavitalea sp. BT771 TaxID=3063329 RepID=UPI0026E2D2B1|nr:cellulase family glycosylhydrolase [Flavitalea sp. BT771]MDO6429330.1 cellulase family glycosylhydrolase [Flavitalea sp. BT771]MDV6218542.1 cellulase family glycosylhydrolase [Flavitalea sp. BT771]